MFRMLLPSGEDRRSILSINKPIKMGKRITAILLQGMGLFLICNQGISAQNMDIKLNLGLKDIVNLAIAQSTSMKYVQNRNVNYYWRYQNFRTGFRPQLILNGDLPNYNHTTEPITQPDGSVEFRQVSNIQMFANVALSQSIPITGTYIYMQLHPYIASKIFSITMWSFPERPFQLVLCSLSSPTIT